MTPPPAVPPAAVSAAPARSGGTNVLDWVSGRGDAPDDAHQLARADASGSGPLTFPPGTYRIRSGLAFTRICQLEPGAVLDIAAGATVHFREGIQAGVHRIFRTAEGGRVILAKTAVGYPEWWGPAPDRSAWLPALQACIAACPITQLQQGDYAIGGELAITTGHRTLRGVAKHWHGEGTSTRIVIDSPTATGIHVFQEPAARGYNDYLPEVRIQDLDVVRGQAPAPPPPGREGRAPAGIRLEQTRFVYLDHVTCQEHCVGFLLDGTIQSHLRDCFAFRSVPGARREGDFFCGYWLNGHAGPPPPAVGQFGNASSYLTDCTAAVGNAPPLARCEGFRLDGAFRDTFLLRPETTDCSVGIRIEGTRDSGDPERRRKGNINLHLATPILDAFGQAGIWATDVAGLGAVTITGGYAAPAPPAPAPAACLRFQRCLGAMRVSGFQCFGIASSACRAVTADHCRAIQLDGNLHVEFLAGAIDLADCANLRVTDQCRNEGVGTGPAVRVSGATTRCYLAPTVTGTGGGRFGAGVEFVGGGASWNEVNGSGIDPAALAGGTGTRKIIFNGKPVRRPGIFGAHNLATGIVD
jgi:hypothetical protein